MPRSGSFAGVLNTVEWTFVRTTLRHVEDADAEIEQLLAALLGPGDVRRSAHVQPGSSARRAHAGAERFGR